MDCLNLRAELRKYLLHFLTHDRLKQRFLIELKLRKSDCGKKRKVVNGIEIFVIGNFLHCDSDHFIVGFLVYF